MIGVLWEERGSLMGRVVVIMEENDKSALGGAGQFDG